MVTIRTTTHAGRAGQVLILYMLGFVPVSVMDNMDMFPTEPAYPRLRVFLTLCGVLPVLVGVAVLVALLVSFFVSPGWLNTDGEVPIVRSMISNDALVLTGLTVIPVLASLLLTLPEMPLAAALAIFLKLHRNFNHSLMLTGVVSGMHVLKLFWIMENVKGAADLWLYFPIYAALCFLAVWYSLLPQKQCPPHET